MQDLVPSNQWHLLNKEPSKKQIAKPGDSDLLKELYNYEMLPKEELNDKLRYFYSPYNIQYKFNKCLLYDDENELEQESKELARNKIVDLILKTDNKVFADYIVSL